jgi:micrococcal nuclease
VVRVQDGDGIDLDVDLGFDTHHLGAFRLLGCNARELSQPGGKEARDHLAALLPPGAKVTVRTVKPDKYGGRYLAAVTLADGTDLVTQLIADGWAMPWDGTGPKPVPPWPRTTQGGTT